jgi:hypothetical protein
LAIAAVGWLFKETEGAVILISSYSADTRLLAARRSEAAALAETSSHFVQGLRRVSLVS